MNNRTVILRQKYLRIPVTRDVARLWNAAVTAPALLEYERAVQLAFMAKLDREILESLAHESKIPA